MIQPYGKSKMLFIGFIWACNLAILNIVWPIAVFEDSRRLARFNAQWAAISPQASYITCGLYDASGLEVVNNEDHMSYLTIRVPVMPLMLQGYVMPQFQ